MTRRLHPCLTCKPEDSTGKFGGKRGFTRHRDRYCARCRRGGQPLPKGWPWGRAA